MFLGIFFAFCLSFLHATSSIGDIPVPPHVSHTILMVIPSYADPTAVAKLFAQLATFQYTIPGTFYSLLHYYTHRMLQFKARNTNSLI